MPNFIVRVALHEAEDDDYVKLHEQMRLKGFKRTIKSSNGVVYDLPHGEYNLVKRLTRQEVRLIAATAVQENGKRASILVTEGPSTWCGLEIHLSQ